ncbi:LacI family DNA-binding transcriptional regulator [Pontiellaceae bacterium B12227]|nr:LacI family DNA-binding transcriptional regulator [Pontiellaceae bacterium B12227]
MAVSQKQIAEQIGVSIALVSRVLSGKAREVGIAEATIEKVMRVAEEMGYVPSAAALTLKGKASRTIGVVVYDFRDPYFGPIIEKLQARAHEQNYSLVIAGFMGRHPDATDLAPLHKHAINGLIVVGSSDQSDWLKSFQSMPVARIGQGSPKDPGVRIAVDEQDAARQILDHLVSKGWKRLSFIGANLFAHSIRFQALEQAAESRGVVLERHIWACDGFEAGLQATGNLQGGDAALVCATDSIAMGALHALHESGRTLPVIGFDDIPAAAQFIPPITTIHQPLSSMVGRAFLAVTEPISAQEITLPGRLVVRHSA